MVGYCGAGVTGITVPGGGDDGDGEGGGVGGGDDGGGGEGGGIISITSGGAGSTGFFFTVKLARADQFPAAGATGLTAQ
ncbi:hypothetical protein ACFLWZ_08690 [Chloroflexota bacterium]